MGAIQCLQGSSDDGLYDAAHVYGVDGYKLVTVKQDSYLVSSRALDSTKTCPCA
jgi:hypothetical protein